MKFAIVTLLACAAVVAQGSWIFGNDIDLNGCQTVTQIVASNYPTLAAALDAADLTDAFNQTDLMITLFAPSEQAFERALDNRNTTATALLAGDSDTLKELLATHVVEGLLWLDSFQLNTENNNQRLVVQPCAYVQGTSSMVKVQTPAMRACRSLVYPIDDLLVPQNSALSLTFAGK